MSFFPAPFLAGAFSKLLTKNSQEIVPSILMPPCPLMIRKVGMHEGHECVVSVFLEGQSNDRLLSQGIWRHPGVLNPTRPLDLRESAVMGRPLEGPVKEAVYLRVQYKFFGCIPGIAGDFWIQPRIENLTRSGRDCALKLEFHRFRRCLHCFFSFFLSSK